MTGDRDTLGRPSAESQAIVRKPFVVRAWLDGQISTPEAVTAASMSDDPAIRAWGRHLAEQYVRALNMTAWDIVGTVLT